MLLIISLAIGLSVFMYQYSTISLSQIQNLTDEESRIEAKSQSFYLSSELGNKILSISNNLNNIVHTKSVRIQDVPSATQIFDSAQNATSDITSVYSWLDKDGKILWTTGNKKRIGEDFSSGDYFLKPKETMMPYYSTTLEVNNTGVQSKNGTNINVTLFLTISYPILNSQPAFNGVIVAGIPISKIGQFAKNHLVPGYNSTIGIMDRNGLILYSGDSTKFVGKKIFDTEIQSLLPSDVKNEFNAFIKNSLQGKSGSVDFTSQGKSSTIAYDPVKISGTDFVLLYISKPHNLSTSTLALVEQSRLLSLISIIVVGIITSLLVIIMFTWNKRLNELVNAKTRDLKISNESLEESNNHLRMLEKSEREFINIAAYELKTPIQSIVLIGEDIEEDLKKDDEYVKLSREYAEIILRNAKRLSSLTSSLLTVSKIENKALHLNKEKINLREKIRDVIVDIKQFIEEGRDLEIIFTPNLDEDIFVEADKNMLFEVISNLITNAIKYTKEGTILINLAKKDGYALVTVQDTGVGITPEISSKIF